MYPTNFLIYFTITVSILMRKRCQSNCYPSGEFAKAYSPVVNESENVNKNLLDGINQTPTKTTPTVYYSTKATNYASLISFMKAKKGKKSSKGKGRAKGRGRKLEKLYKTKQQFFLISTAMPIVGSSISQLMNNKVEMTEEKRTYDVSATENEETYKNTNKLTQQSMVQCANGEIKLTKTYICVPCTVFSELEMDACSLRAFKQICGQAYHQVCLMPARDSTLKKSNEDFYDTLR